MKKISTTALSLALSSSLFASATINNNFSKNIIDDFCIATDEIECNKMSILNQEVDVDTSVFYIQRDIIRPINGLLQHDIGSAVDEIASNPIGPHTQPTVDTFKAITKLPEEFKDTNAISLSANNLITYRYKNYTIGINSSVLLKSSVYLNANYNKLILEADLSGASAKFNTGTGDTGGAVDMPSVGNAYIEYDPYTDSYKLSDESGYKSSSLVYAIYQGIDYLKLRGIKMVEIPLKYRYLYSLNDNGKILLSPKVSIMSGTTFNKNLNFISIGNAVESGDYESLVSDTYVSAYNYRLGFDMQYTLNNFGIKLTANNINNPTFNTKVADENITYYNEYNLSTSYLYLSNFISTVAYDLVPTATQISNYSMQYIYGDTTWFAFDWLSLNINSRYNLANSDEGVVVGTDITAGWENFKINLYANTSLNTTTLEVVSMSVPNYAKVGLNLIGKW